MEVLFIESSPGIASSVQHRLIRDGHWVVTCNDSQLGPCRGVESNAGCPLDRHIDVAVLARQRGAEPSLNEMGAVCAQRRRVPLVTLYPGDEFGPGVSTEVAASVARREVEAAYVAAIRHELGHTVGDITVQREHSRIHATVTISGEWTSQQIGMVADRARHAIREHDRHTPVVDISIVRAAPCDEDSSIG